jgi:CRISPR/Cas system-associated exonuclease Cas4 (RecB family)
MLTPPKVPEHVLKHAPWSISKADVIERCSLQFDYKYVQKKEEIALGAAARMGQAVHTTLEHMLKPIQPIDMAEETLFRDNANRAFEHSKAFHGLTQDEIDELDSFRENVETFARRMVKMRAKYNAPPPLLESKWGMMLDGSRAEFFNNKGFLRGVVDFGLIIPHPEGDNSLVIIDHKSGKLKPIEEYTRQLRSYCVMALSQVPNLRGVQTGIHFVKTGQTFMNSYATRETIAETYYPYIIEEIITAAAKLAHPPRPSPSWHCNWCGYASICPAKNKASENDREEK